MMREIKAMPIRNLQKFHGQIICGIGCEKGPTPGLKTPGIHDEPDALDVGDVVEGLGVDDWRRVVECVGMFGGLWGKC